MFPTVFSIKDFSTGWGENEVKAKRWQYMTYGPNNCKDTKP
jgi:hypothetical protein